QHRVTGRINLVVSVFVGGGTDGGSFYLHGGSGQAGPGFLIGDSAPDAGLQQVDPDGQFGDFGKSWGVSGGGDQLPAQRAGVHRMAGNVNDGDGFINGFEGQLPFHGHDFHDVPDGQIGLPARELAVDVHPLGIVDKIVIGFLLNQAEYFANGFSLQVGVNDLIQLGMRVMPE